MRRSLEVEIPLALAHEDLGKQTKASLKHLQEIAKWGAHPTTVQTAGAPADGGDDPGTKLIRVTPEEAAYTLEIVEMCFDDLYRAPARARQMAQGIDAKKTGGAPEQAMD